MTSFDVGRLGHAVRERRTELGLSQVELWKAGGPSNSTLTTIESGRDLPVHPKTLRKLDFALGWPSGQSYHLLHGHIVDEAGVDEHVWESGSGDEPDLPAVAAPARIRLEEPVIAALLHDADQARRALVRYSNRRLDFDVLAARVYRLIDTAETVAEQASENGSGSTGSSVDRNRGHRWSDCVYTSGSRPGAG